MFSMVQTFTMQWKIQPLYQKYFIAIEQNVTIAVDFSVLCFSRFIIPIICYRLDSGLSAKCFAILGSASMFSVNFLAQGVRPGNSGHPTLQNCIAAYNQHSASPGYKIISNSTLRSCTLSDHFNIEFRTIPWI